MPVVTLLKPLITNPRTVEFPALITKPCTVPEARDPFSSIIGVPAKPGCVVPSIITGRVIVGRAEVGLIVNGPGPGRLNTIVLVPPPALESRIACRKEPGPPSSVLVTVKVELGSGGPTVCTVQTQLNCAA